MLMIYLCIIITWLFIATVYLVSYTKKLDYFFREIEKKLEELRHE